MSVVSVNVRILEPHGDLGQTQPLPRASIPLIVVPFVFFWDLNTFQELCWRRQSRFSRYSWCSPRRYYGRPYTKGNSGVFESLGFILYSPHKRRMVAWYSGSRGISLQRGTIRCDGMMEAKQLYSIECI
jgi:hypothetical protein